jgi:hypothetical protein
MAVGVSPAIIAVGLVSAAIPVGVVAAVVGVAAGGVSPQAASIGTSKMLNISAAQARFDNILLIKISSLVIWVLASACLLYHENRASQDVNRQDAKSARKPPRL